jgi:hypothetical protein
MERVGIRRYSGSAGEKVTVTAQVTGSAAVKFILDGKDKGTTPPFTFQLQGKPGDTSDLSIGLFGDVGTTCKVAITVIDNGVDHADRDVLLSTQHDPFPVHDYEFVTVA